MLQKSRCNKCQKEILVAMVIPIDENDPNPTGIPAYCWDDSAQQEKYVHDLCIECASELSSTTKACMGTSGIRGDWDILYLH